MGFLWTIEQLLQPFYTIIYLYHLIPDQRMSLLRYVTPTWFDQNIGEVKQGE